ncbi:YccF domain-containing protein [Fodinibius salsisoli]|uniref:YccF domain-containing protein n=1 Tax=Fodinibius salsisoli TaxID=2820877 RepID=A0ABT3PSN2_9BACT|nr:YccF domain-containing protein [Fodinibius salsisoli]MCW9708840.1 YccF domain-containing protein [Fodinibius salsisoli]
MKALGNVLWFIFGGFIAGLLWWFAGVMMFISIVGIPWGKACFAIGNLSFFPFGKEAVNREILTGKEDVGTGGWGTLGNVLWFIFGGFWLALSHALAAIISFITIIGIPFGIQHGKLARISLSPIGKEVVDKEVAEQARKKSAKRVVEEYSN